MKKYLAYIISAAIVSLTFASCAKWLDIMQDDNVSEDQQFASYDGYHAATNGIYQGLSKMELFGGELNYGFSSALSQYLSSPYEDEDSYKNNSYLYTESYRYDTPEVRNLTKDIWEEGYTVIADCNNLIKHIESADRSIFPNADQYFEPEMIRGEAYAARAFMHFELLRLFGPSPAANMNGRAIPYRDSYPEQFGSISTTGQVLDRIIKDLELAYSLVELFDNPDDHEDTSQSAPGSNYLNMDMRFAIRNSAPGLFFHTRGVRFNSIAIESLLARVYAYAGDLENANKYASDVYERVVVKNPLYNYTVFGTAPNQIIGDRPHKLMNEITIGLYNYKLAEQYDANIGAASLSNPTFFIKNVHYMYNTFRSDPQDVRFSRLLVDKAPTSADRNQYFSIRNSSRTDAEAMENFVIPIMRFSELRHIMAEYLAKNGDVPAAVEILSDHRSKRGATRVLDPGMSLELFMEELEYDMWKEYTMEGQLFFYWKRINAPRVRTGASFIEMTADKYVLPIPDSETNFQQ